MKFGSAGAITLASAPIRPITMIPTAPASATLWRRNRRQTVLRDGATSSSTAPAAEGVSGRLAAISAVLHARIEPGVAHVGEEVAEHDQRRDEQHVAHQ